MCWPSYGNRPGSTQCLLEILVTSVLYICGSIAWDDPGRRIFRLEKTLHCTASLLSRQYSQERLRTRDEKIIAPFLAWYNSPLRHHYPVWERAQYDNACQVAGTTLYALVDGVNPRGRQDFPGDFSGAEIIRSLFGSAGFKKPAMGTAPSGFFEFSALEKIFSHVMIFPIAQPVPRRGTGHSTMIRVWLQLKHRHSNGECADGGGEAPGSVPYRHA